MTILGFRNSACSGPLENTFDFFVDALLHLLIERRGHIYVWKLGIGLNAERQEIIQSLLV